MVIVTQKFSDLTAKPPQSTDQGGFYILMMTRLHLNRLSTTSCSRLATSVFRLPTSDFIKCSLRLLRAQGAALRSSDFGLPTSLLHKRLCFGNRCGQTIQVFTTCCSVKCLTAAAALHFFGSFADNCSGIQTFFSN